eukprot:6382582-Amphidinium_carterae.2
MDALEAIVGLRLFRCTAIMSLCGCTPSYQVRFATSMVSRRTLLRGAETLLAERECSSMQMRSRNQAGVRVEHYSLQFSIATCSSLQHKQ